MAQPSLPKMYSQTWFKILEQKRGRALKEYSKASASYLNALKATEEEVSLCANSLADQISEMKPSDFAGEITCWDHMLADEIEELRQQAKEDPPGPLAQQLTPPPNPPKKGK